MAGSSFVLVIISCQKHQVHMWQYDLHYCRLELLELSHNSGPQLAVNGMMPSHACCHTVATRKTPCTNAIHKSLEAHGKIEAMHGTRCRPLREGSGKYWPGSTRLGLCRKSNHSLQEHGSQLYVLCIAPCRKHSSRQGTWDTTLDKTPNTITTIQQYNSSPPKSWQLRCTSPGLPYIAL